MGGGKQGGGGNEKLLHKILSSSPAAVAREFVQAGRMADVYKVRYRLGVELGVWGSGFRV